MPPPTSTPARQPKKAAGKKRAADNISTSVQDGKVESKPKTAATPRKRTKSAGDGITDGALQPLVGDDLPDVVMEDAPVKAASSAKSAKSKGKEKAKAKPRTAPKPKKSTNATGPNTAASITAAIQAQDANTPLDIEMEDESATIMMPAKSAKGKGKEKVVPKPQTSKAMASHRSAIKARKEQRTAMAKAGEDAAVSLTNAAVGSTPLAVNRPATVLPTTAPVLSATVSGIAPVGGKSSHPMCGIH
jgi:hypothetical protein